MLQEDRWIYAPYLIFDARRILAGLRSFSDRVHANAYSIPSVAIELGVPVAFQEDRTRESFGGCFRDDAGMVIRLNDQMENTLYAMAALTHELGHAIRDDVSPLCRGSLRKQAERDAWLRGIYIAISRPLAEAVWNGETTTQEVATRCCVPTLIVEARVGLAVTLGEVEGYAPAAYEMIAEQLLQLEQWFEDGRRHGFRAHVEA